MTTATDPRDLTESAGARLLDKVTIPQLSSPLVPARCRLASDLPSGPVAWRSLDEQDNEPVAFWTLTIEALRRHGVNLPADLQCPSEPSSHFLAFLDELSAAFRSRSEPVVLVLDGFDAVTDHRVVRQLVLLLRQTEPELRPLVATRRSPSGVLGGCRPTVEL